MKAPSENQPPPPSRSLPLVTQIGFAGARELFDRDRHPDIDPQTFAGKVATEIAGLLEKFPEELGLQASTALFCGVSQIAIGGDTAFTLACQQLEILQRIFLPQHLDSYLSATGSKGPDFNEVQRAAAEQLLRNKNVIQTRVVSDAADRHDRFRDVNAEIARVGDVLVCLVRNEQDGKAGGTHELIELARNRKRPVLVLKVDVGGNGEPVISSDWEGKERFVRPTLPKKFPENVMLQGATGAVPASDAYCQSLKDLGSGHANRLRFGFRRAAWIIVVGHVLATVLAACALKWHGGIVPWLLGTELVLLLAGLLVHRNLHTTHSIGRWATFRLVAEVARSVRAIGTFPLYLEHFFTLPFPVSFRPLLRTISVLHLKDTADADATQWKTQRDTYVQQRLLDQNAQIPYHRRTRDKAKTWLKIAHRLFYTASVSALIATTLKLLTLCHCLPLDQRFEEPFTAVMGMLAITLPVIAVAALSLAVAFDLEAKWHTSKEMLEFLEHQQSLLKKASDPREFGRLVIETETRLLGETVNWYARRSFVGVA